MSKMVVVKLPKDEKIESLLESLLEHLSELKEEASEIRKQGMDTAVVDLMMTDILPKIKFARTTYDDADVGAVKRSLAQIRHEIDLIRTGTEFDAALVKIQDAYNDIRGGKLADATSTYLQLREVYPKLPEDLRRIVYKAALDIHRRISQGMRENG
ncbi:hypothetical protein JW898_00810 [Candidatus Woesearchaeota archaeon]|nr:hypothetical protein [Candidatus Woesearchaeota archaeon]